MDAEEYEREYDKEPPDPMEDLSTMGTTPDPAFDSSPDVAVDGSVDRGKNGGYNDSQKKGSKGLFQRLRGWLY